MSDTPDNNNDINNNDVESEVDVVITNVTEEEITSQAYVKTTSEELEPATDNTPEDTTTSDYVEAVSEEEPTKDTASEDDKPTTYPEPVVATDELRGRIVKLIMPSIGDMQVITQDGGIVYLQPHYFSNVCSGPIIQFIDLYSSGKNVTTSSYRIMFKPNGEAKLAKAD